jgi:RND family efflux transporter MFP subunit
MKNKMILLLAVATYTLVSCGEKNTDETVTNIPAILVQTATVANNTNSPFITASGSIEASNSANLSTRMMGHITKLHVTVGQKVTKGQNIVSVNNADLQAKKAQVDAGIAQAQAAFTNAKRDYERFTALFAQQSASQKELDDMTARYEMAKAGLESANQMRKEVQAQFAYANIVAPFNGIVTNTFIKEGDMANPGMPLVSIEGAKAYEVVAGVTENDINKIKEGMEVSVFLKSKNTTLKGKVTEVSLSSRNTGGQFLVKVSLDKTDEKILPGMYATIQFPVANDASNTDKILVPAETIITKGDLKGLYTISNQNTAVLRWVRLGRTYGDKVEILSGLDQNETYITEAQGKLYNGVPVSTK